MRERIEAALERLGRAAVRRPLWGIVLILALSASLMSQLPKLGLETAVENFLDESDPARVLWTEFRAQFGRAEMVIIAIDPPDVFDLEFLRKLERFHEEIEETAPYVDEVNSLVNARLTYGAEDELIVEDLLETFPESEAELVVLRERVLSSAFYPNLIISEDGTLTIMTVIAQLYASDSREDALEGFDDVTDDADEPALLSGLEVGAMVDGIQEIADRYRSDDFEIAMSGSPVLQQQLAKAMARDMRRFMAAMLAVISGVLFFLFRRISAVLLPILVVMLSVLATFGAMAATGTYLATPSQILPTFLLAVGMGAAVHILKMFYMRYDEGASVEDSVGYAMRHSGLAVVMTSITTAGGLLSFQAAGLTPIRDIGVFAPLGVMLSLAYCLVLLPSLLGILRLRRRPVASKDDRSAGRLDRLIVRGGEFSVDHPGIAIALSAVVALASLAGAMRLEFSNDVMGWFPEGDTILVATDLIDSRLGGSFTLEIIADTGAENGVKDPAFLNGFEALRERSVELRRGDYLFVGKTMAVSDILKEIHQALNENRPEFYAIPQDPHLISQELLLFENTGADDLEDFVDTRFSLARFTMKVPYADPMRYDGYLVEARDLALEVMPPGVEIQVTGFMGMLGQTLTHVVTGMARSYALAAAIISILMILVIGNLRGGLVSMVPNLLPILLTLGIMGWVGIRIDTFTMMIGSIAIGLAVDDTIHFIHCFRRELERLHDPRAAVRETLETTGRALLATSLVLSAGFLIFSLSQMKNLFFFGVLTSFTIIMAFIIDILVTPALMVVVTCKATQPKS